MDLETTFVKCNTHQSKMAKKYCTECKIFICNSCALEQHHTHINKLNKLNVMYLSNLQNFKKISENLYKMNIDEKLNFKCMNFVFHEAKNFCKQCKNFICEKCIPIHLNNNEFTDHEIIQMKYYMDNLKNKIELFVEILNFDYNEKIKNTEFQFDIYEQIKHLNTVVDENLLNKIYDFKNKFQNVLLTFENIRIAILDKIHKFFTRKDNFICKNKNKFDEFQKIFDIIKFEKDKVKVYEHYIEFEYVIDGLLDLKESEYVRKLFLSLKSYDEYIKNASYRLKEKIDLFMSQMGSLIDQEIKLLSENETHFSDEICNLLNIKSDEYQNFKTKRTKNSNYHDPADLSYSIIPSNNKEHVLDSPSNNYFISNKNDFQIQGQKKEKEIVIEQIFTPSQFNSNLFKIYSQNIQLNGTVITKNELTTNNYIQKSHEALTQCNKEQIHNQSPKETKIYLNTEEKINNNNIQPYKDNEQESDESFSNTVSNISSRKNTNTNKNDENVENIPNNHDQIKIFTNSIKKANLVSDENYDHNTGEIKIQESNHRESLKDPVEIYKQKIEVLKLKISEIHPKGLTDFLVDYESIDATQKKKLQSLVKDILMTLTWEERNLLEIVSFGYNCKSTFVFNPFLPIIEEIEFTHFKFPSYHAFVNILPWVYLSGGKDVNLNKDLDSFYKIRRSGEKSYELFELANMNQPRNYHALISHSNFIYAISGSRVISCERYDINENKWTLLPNLNSSREKAGCLIVNDQYLYVFLGLDRTLNKFISTVEKLDLTLLNKFEVIIPKGIQSLLKRQSMSIIYSNPNNDKNLILVGGINSLRNPVKEILSYDIVLNQFTLQKNFSLNVNSSFNNQCFTKLELWDELFNFNENFEIVKFDPVKTSFS